MIQQLQLRHPSSSEVFNWHSNFPTGVVADNFDIPSLDRLGEPGVLLPCRERLLNMDDGMQMNNLELISDQVKLTHEDTHAGKQLLLTLPWKLPNYCQNELEECCDLGDVLVVTGSPSNAYAAGCRESLKIWWPNCRFDILDLVKQMMAVKTGTYSPLKRRDLVCGKEKIIDKREHNVRFDDALDGEGERMTSHPWLTWR